MLTRELLFGFNLISLTGFVLMGFAMSLSRQRRLGKPAAFGLMAAGTALMLLGFFCLVPRA